MDKTKMFDGALLGDSFWFGHNKMRIASLDMNFVKAQDEKSGDYIHFDYKGRMMDNFNERGHGCVCSWTKPELSIKRPDVMSKVNKSEGSENLAELDRMSITLYRRQRTA